MNSFSGAHPFRPACLIAAYEEALQGGYDPAHLHDEAVEFAARAVEMADAGNCPCCGDRFAEGEIPSGSRLTDCRCIPVCAGCGHREGIPIPLLREANGDGGDVAAAFRYLEWNLDLPAAGLADAEREAAFEWAVRRTARDVLPLRESILRVAAAVEGLAPGERLDGRDVADVAQGCSS